jgi:hypothetical protein
MILDPPVKHWSCPSCGATHVTREARPHTPMHPCPKVRGFSTPFVEDGLAAVHRVQIREDYIAGDDVQLAVDGTPIMSIAVESDDAPPATFVYAPTAHGGAAALK